MTHERRVIEDVDREPVARQEVTTVSTGPSASSTLRRVVTLLFGILQVLIVLRVVLLLLAANQDNAIVSAILGATDPFVEPFRGMFRLDQVSGRSGSLLDVGAIVALIAWTLIEALVLAVVGLADRRSETVA
jgi:uncharacterized protein YggT (Ycf19 family)